jgi:beta-lactam-binding protein with PASTA domain
VRKKHSRRALRGRVVAQNPRAGTTKRRGYPVSLVIGRR